MLLSFGLSVELIVVFGMCLLSLQSSIMDLLTEAKYSEIMRENPSTSSAVSVFANGSQRFGYLVSKTGELVFASNSSEKVAFVAVGGLLAASFFRLLFVATSVVCGSLFVPILFNFLPEALIIRTQGMIGCSLLLIDWPKVKREFKMLLLIASCGFTSVGLSLLPVFWKSLVGLIVSTVLFYLTTGMFVLLAYFVFPSPIISKVALFLVLARVQRPSMSSALDYFYTSKCQLDGPMLSVFFYVTVLGVVSAAASVVGLIIYQIFLKAWTFRSVIFLTVALSAFGSLSDVFVTTRANTWLGIPDSVAVLIGDAVVEPIVSMLNWVPGTILISQACPKGLESSMFAFLAGISNLALSGTVLQGALIMRFAGIDSSDKVCDYSSLPVLVIVCHVIIPLVVGTASAFLLPNTPQNQPLE